MAGDRLERLFAQSANEPLAPRRRAPARKTEIDPSRRGPRKERLLDVAIPRGIDAFGRFHELLECRIAMVEALLETTIEEACARAGLRVVDPPWVRVVAEIRLGGRITERALMVVGPELGVPVEREVEASIAWSEVNNDWAAETFKDHLGAFAPSISLPLLDIAASVKELERAAGLGLRPLLMPDVIPSKHGE